MSFGAIRLRIDIGAYNSDGIIHTERILVPFYTYLWLCFYLGDFKVQVHLTLDSDVVIYDRDLEQIQGTLHTWISTVILKQYNTICHDITQGIRNFD